MEEIISILTDGLIELRRTTSLNTDDIAKINAVLEELQSNQLSSQEIEKLVIILATGYFKTKNDDYDTMINELMTKITAENEAKLTEMINQSIEAFKSDLTEFKGTIKNGKDGISPKIDYEIIDRSVFSYIRDNKYLFKGKDGISPTSEDIKSITYKWLNENKESLKGKDGDFKRGLDGIGISDITYKNGTLTVTLSDGTKKNIKLNIPTQYIGGGGSVSAEYVNTAIAEAIGGGGTIDAYTKEETDNLLLDKANKTDVYTIEEIDNQQNLFIQDTQPTQTAPYMWVQTFVNGDLTFWIEDGK